MRALCTFLTCACALLLAVLTGCGEDRGLTPMAKASGFNGRFRAPGKDLLVLAERGDAVDLTMNGETVTGRKTSAGRVEGDSPVQGGRLQFVLTLDGDDLKVRFTASIEGGETTEVPETTYRRIPVDPPGLARDARLAAHWRHTEAYTSGDFSYVQDTHLVLDADGTMATWSKTASSGGERTTGSWKTQDGELLIRTDAGGEWASWGRFAVTDTNLMLTRGGSKTVYERL